MNPQSQIFDVTELRQDFPILDQLVHNKHPLIYFDNGASTQRPRSVIESMTRLYEQGYANVHRGIHFLSEHSSDLYEQTRNKVRMFIGARHANEIIFTSGTTLAINTVAHAWGNANVSEGDEILLTLMEHHSNIVPWQQLAERTGARVVWVNVTPDGKLDLEDLKNKLTERTKLFGFTAVSNVLGTMNPVTDLVAMAHQVGAKVMIDAAQHAPHEPLDVTQWDADFVTFSAHKMLGPSGIGILYGKQELLESMPPFLGGGSMISKVAQDGFTVGELPAKFEAGTPPIAEAVGLGAAIEYLLEVGLENIAAHERILVERAYELLKPVEGLEILGPPPKERAGILSFTVSQLSPQDISIFLDRKGVAIRAGHHCAMPLHDHLKLNSSCRASFYFYNTLDEVDRFAELLAGVISKLRG